MQDEQPFDKNTWGTPPALFNALDEFFHFTIDVAASKDNALCDRFYTKEEDGLAQSWGGESVWCNPPYGKGLLEPWLEKAFVETSFIGRLKGEYANVAVLLLPARTSMGWYHEYCLPAEIFPIKGRVSFVKPVDRVKKDSSPPEHHMVVVYLGSHFHGFDRMHLQDILSNPTIPMLGREKGAAYNDLFEEIDK